MHAPPNFMTSEVSQLLITYFDILIGCNTVDLMEFTAQGSFWLTKHVYGLVGEI